MTKRDEGLDYFKLQDFTVYLSIQETYDYVSY